MSRKLAPGSRLAIALDVNFNPFAQVNYGTGEPVADENLNADTKPLSVEILPGSYVELPTWSGHAAGDHE